MNNDVSNYLASNQAEGVTYNATTILLVKNPGRAAVFEELINSAQYRQGKNDGSALSRILCEIEAQEKLIKNRKAYQLTALEVEQTKKALEYYKAELKKLS